MSKHNDDVALAEQLLGLLGEMEKNKAYDLLLLCEHLPVQDTDRLIRVAQALEKQQCLRLVDLADGEGRLAVVWQKNEFQPSSLGVEKSIIVDASIQLTTDVSPHHQQTRNQPKQRAENVNTEKRPTLDPGDLTIGQILLALSNAVESTPTVSGAEKTKLVEMLDYVLSCEGIQNWLTMEVKKVLGDS